MPDATLRLGGYQAETSILTRSLRRLAAALADVPDANWHVEVMRDVTERALAPSTSCRWWRRAASTSAISPRAIWWAASPRSAVFDKPFAVVDRARIYAELDGDLGARLAGDVARHTGYRVRRLLGQRLAPHLQPAAADPPSRRLPRHAHPHARQRHLSAGACGHGLHRR